MTPHIRMAAEPKFDCDTNDVRLSDWRALRVVNFEFFPHYSDRRDYSDSLLELSRFSPYPIYACCDGAALHKTKNQQTLFGRVWMFHQGQKLRVT